MVMLTIFYCVQKSINFMNECNFQTYHGRRLFCHISICVVQAFGAVVKAEVLSSHPVVKYMKTNPEDKNVKLSFYVDTKLTSG